MSKSAVIHAPESADTISSDQEQYQDPVQIPVTRPETHPPTTEADNLNQQPHEPDKTGPLTVAEAFTPAKSQLQSSEPLPGGSQIEKPPTQTPAVSSGGSLQEIGLTFSFLALPMLAVVAVLLYLIYSHQLPQQGSHSQCSGIIVDYGAAQLTSVSSWISTIAGYLVGPLMILLSYSVTKLLMKSSISQRHACLPTAYQFSLLLSLLGAGVLPVWAAAKYIVAKRQRGVKLSKPLLLCFQTLLSFLILSLLTQLADFWLHRSMTSFLYSLTSPQDPASYGRILSDYCETYYKNPNQTEQEKSSDLCGGFLTRQGERWPCSVTGCADQHGQYCPTEYPEGFAVATSQSTNTTIAVTNGLDAADSHDLVLLMPADVPNGISWEALTVGVETRCRYIMQECAVVSSPASFQFNCSDGFSNWGQGSLGVKIDDSNAVFDPPNPIQFYVAAMLGATGGYLRRNDSNLQVTESAIRTLLSCTSSVYDVHYHTSNNNNISVLSHKLSDKKTTQTVQGPLIKTFTVSPYIQQAILSSVYFTQTDDETLRQIEQGWGRVALAFSSPSFDTQSTINRSMTQQRIVSCVHRAPLGCLIALACLYALVAAVLAVIGVWSSRDNPRSAQVQLGIAGVTAAAVEEKQPARRMRDADELFAEMRSRKTTAVEDKMNEQSLRSRGIGFRDVGSMRWE